MKPENVSIYCENMKQDWNEMWDMLKSLLFWKPNQQENKKEGRIAIHGKEICMIGPDDDFFLRRRPVQGCYPMTDFQTIQTALPRSEILAQLAEECAELSQAALKLRRAITGDNPTPVCVDDAEDAMREEIADVLLCVELAGEYLYDPMTTEEIRDVMERKEKRWAKRLKGAEK